MNWVELNTTQFANLSRDTVCILPLGATEQHGPHLPVATDQIIADTIVANVDQMCDGKLLVMPGLPATCSAHHMAFPGTLTLRHRTLSRVVLEMIGSAAQHGFTRFFILNAHGGNMAISGVIAEQAMTDFPHAEIVVSTWFRVATSELRQLVTGEYPAIGHACEFETSLMLAIRPELVDRDAIVDDGKAPPEPLRGDLLTGGPTIQSLPFDQITRSGVWGKPSKAAAEKGNRILNIVVPAIKQLLAGHWPDAPGLANATNELNRRVEVFNGLNGAAR
jgi:creatinine amidohydrolase